MKSCQTPLSGCILLNFTRDKSAPVKNPTANLPLIPPVTFFQISWGVQTCSVVFLNKEHMLWRASTELLFYFVWFGVFAEVVWHYSKASPTNTCRNITTFAQRWYNKYCQKSVNESRKVIPRQAWHMSSRLLWRSTAAEFPKHLIIQAEIPNRTPRGLEVSFPSSISVGIQGPFWHFKLAYFLFLLGSSQIIL